MRFARTPAVPAAAKARNAGRFTRTRPVPPALAGPDPEPGVIAGPVRVSPAGICFLVRPVAGPPMPYLLGGLHPAGVLRPGDLVRVRAGAARPDGTVAARAVEVLATLNGPVLRRLAGPDAPHA